MILVYRVSTHNFSLKNEYITNCSIFVYLTFKVDLGLDFSIWFTLLN